MCVHLYMPKVGHDSECHKTLRFFFSRLGITKVPLDFLIGHSQHSSEIQREVKFH